MLSPRDETRLKLIEAAGQIFGEVGFEAATIRDICARAGANVAGVNYHFRDKLGLYTETLKAAVGEAVVPPTESRLVAPEERLRLFLKEMLKHMYSPDRPAWCTKVMAHEMAQPTPGMAIVVEQVMRPKVLALCELVGPVIGRPSLHVQTRMCVHSIFGQVVHYMHSRQVINLLWPAWDLTPEAMESVAEHITQFSLEAMNGIKRANARAAKPQTKGHALKMVSDRPPVP